MTPFIIYALPRSRTAWLAHYLSYGGWHCGHDEARHMRGLDDIQAWLRQPMTGTVETAAAPWWRLVQSYRPDARVAVVRRPVDEVVDSLRRAGVSAPDGALEAAMWRLDRKLDQIAARVPGVLSVDFSDLEREEACAALFRHCLGMDHDPAWWAALAPVNVQINMAALFRYAEAHRPQLERLAGIAGQRIRSHLAARKVAQTDGMTLQVEPFADFYRDGTDLFREHMATVGEDPQAYDTKNIPLLRKLDELGCLQVVTARCNGRMFGYLMSIVCPNLEKEGETSSLHTTFFASQAAPGLGLKLQRFANAALKARGVDEVVMRAGVRGSGAKLAALYRRVGAEDMGRVFRLRLTEA